MCDQKIPIRPSSESDRLYKSIASRQHQLSEMLLSHFLENERSALEGDKSRANTMTAERIKKLIRIVGGVPALDGEFDECCLIGQRNRMGMVEWFCTGVLIHPRIVISAAHCIQTGGAYLVALGTNNQNRLQTAEILTTRKVVVHPGYTPSTHLNDLAVLVLQQTATTPPVMIASTAQINAAAEVELVGFGNDDFASTRGFGIKRKVSVDLVSLRRDPAEDLNAEEALYGYESDLEFVAGGKGFDTCNGDSGGPVYLLQNGGKRTVAGLTSRSTANSVNPCGDGGVYTRLDVHQVFINSFL